MKLDALIKRLQEIKNEHHGDLDVFYKDPTVNDVEPVDMVEPAWPCKIVNNISLWGTIDKAQPPYCVWLQLGS